MERSIVFTLLERHLGSLPTTRTRAVAGHIDLLSDPAGDFGFHRHGALAGDVGRRPTVIV